VNDATNETEIVIEGKKRITAPRRATVGDEGLLDAKVAFDLGWDAYASGMELSGWRKYYKAIRLGWVASSNKKVTQVVTSPNRYVRKLLKLRLNAWLRSRQFNASVNEDFLRQIDVKYCPVTLELLTHGAMQPTDWSVDRINNRGGYGVSNLAIMSTRANVAKANYSYNKIHGFAHNPDANIPEELYQDDGNSLVPLTRVEWARMAVICSYGPSSQDDDGILSLPSRVTPCVIAPPPCLMSSIPNMLQMVIAYKANFSKSHGINFAFDKRMKGFSDLLIKGMSPLHRKELNKLVSRAKKVNYNINDPLSMWFNKALFIHFLEFFRNINEEEKALMLNHISKSQFLSKSKLDRTERLNLDNKGYISN